MQSNLRRAFELSDWQADSGKRLNIGMFFATLLVAAILSVLQFPAVEMLSRSASPTLVVDIAPPEEVPAEAVSPDVQETPREIVEGSVESTTQPAEQTEEQAAESRGRIIAEPDLVTVTEPDIDWEAQKLNAVRDAVDDLQTIVSINPNLDRRRKEAAVRFRPSEAPVKKEIWDNVEKDYLGRTVLRSGNCFRILDDPSAVNRDVFETFGQYMTHCGGGRYVGVELPWVEEIRKKFTYLREREEKRHRRYRENQELPAE